MPGQDFVILAIILLSLLSCRVSVTRDKTKDLGDVSCDEEKKERTPPSVSRHSQNEALHFFYLATQKMKKLKTGV